MFLLSQNAKALVSQRSSKSCHNNGNPVDPIAGGREAQSIGYTNSWRKPRQGNSSACEQEPELHSSWRDSSLYKVNLLAIFCPFIGPEAFRHKHLPYRHGATTPINRHGRRQALLVWPPLFCSCLRAYYHFPSPHNSLAPWPHWRREGPLIALPRSENLQAQSQRWPMPYWWIPSIPITRSNPPCLPLPRPHDRSYGINTRGGERNVYGW